tara:strand:- start:387 stop:635 length:249 start_codon:yes stop_codon:yes gene_type:complete
MWQRMTSRKFLAALGAAIGATIAASQGAVTWAEAVNAWALLAAGYAIGEGIADGGGAAFAMLSTYSEQSVRSGDSGKATNET